ncbi:hypothetical protein LTR48_003474 [Friedmanniomyces endolithicus]|uniref:dihydroneopterin aldolase n=1 Tax=Rachicladosporium monterosium TaxID=1507873 RepID=A0ABR0L8E2_9PEZI|nr:hypothetical protein LTR29_003663 [Friedmanniomyces endolithicus]KAK1086520.1 hypothetical protein LTR48_003474 [Friedmanniomyces endolithicus]KAK5145064.1 hypothetical protein LTR32_003124 [Rachicladosporium monterosium]
MADPSISLIPFPGPGTSTQPHQPPHPNNNNQDIISVKNLQLPAGVVAPDVWGKAKEQPALLTVSLVLRGEGFGKAAEGDRLDASTIHYGELSKRIRAACSTPNQTAGHVSAYAERVIAEMSRKTAASFIVARSIVDVHLPKASMYGDGITLTNITDYDERGRTRAARRVFVVKGVKLMLLVGVNGYERGGKQPVLASLWLDLGDAGPLEGGSGSRSGSGSTVALFNLEQTLVQITQDTSFETLESLAEFTVKQLQERLLNKILPGSQVHLRLEKPRAIPFADAPAVEVFRETPGGAGAARYPMPSAEPFVGSIQHHRAGTVATVGSVDQTKGGQVERLNIIRPYV